MPREHAKIASYMFVLLCKSNSLNYQQIVCILFPILHACMLICIIIGSLYAQYRRGACFWFVRQFSLSIGHVFVHRSF